MIGAFGGAFNPIHSGHLMLAEFIRDEFGLEKVIFIPAGKPPHKREEEMESPLHRYNMVKTATDDNPFFETSDIELNRRGFTYTADTLEELTQRNDGKRLFFICGADSIIQLPTWHNIGKIFKYADLIVAGRHHVDNKDITNLVQRLRKEYGAGILFSDAPLIEISSTVIRERINRGQSIRYMVPRGVESYIYQHGLYKGVCK